MNLIIDTLEEIILDGGLDKEDINFWKDDIKKIPKLRLALMHYLENKTPVSKYSGLVKRVLKKSDIDDKEFKELMLILTKKKRLNYRGIKFAYEKTIDYSDDTGEFSLEIDEYGCVLFTNGMEIAETDSYDRSEGNVRLLYEIVLKARDKGLLD